MSDSTATTAPTATTSATEKKPAENSSAPAAAVPAEVPKGTEGSEHVPGTDSLEKLLSHISELKRENTELEEAMRYVREGNLAKLKSSIAEKIQPWISSLDIADEYKTSFLSGIEKACEAGGSKTMTNFEDNPVYTVVCSAAAAHGMAIQELEDTRKKLHTAEETYKADLSKHEGKIKERTDALLYASNNDASRPSKRSHEQIASNTENTQDIWDSMFTSLTNTNGRF